MDRLLTPNEQPNIPQDAFSIYDWKTALQIESYINDVKKLQDSKTASLVAQEIIKDYETAFEPTVPMSITYEKHHAIKSKWGIE